MYCHVICVWAIHSQSRDFYFVQRPSAKDQAKDLLELLLLLFLLLTRWFISSFKWKIVLKNYRLTRVFNLWTFASQTVTLLTELQDTEYILSKKIRCSCRPRTSISRLACFFQTFALHWNFTTAGNFISMHIRIQQTWLVWLRLVSIGPPRLSLSEPPPRSSRRLDFHKKTRLSPPPEAIKDPSVAGKNTPIVGRLARFYPCNAKGNMSLLRRDSQLCSHVQEA